MASAGNWIWSDGTEYDPKTAEWSSDDPTNNNNMEYCALINENEQWEDHNCGLRRPYICKWDTRNTEPIIVTQKPPEGECFEGTYKLKDRCYDLRSMAEPKTWIEAHKECQFRSGQLASIHSQGVQGLLSFPLKNIQNDVWIGLSRFGKFDQYYWADGSAVDFTNWALGEPNGPFQQDGDNKVNYCAQLSNNPIYAGKWSDVDCEKENGFICEMPLDTKGNPQPVPYEPCPVKLNYHKYEDSCFRVFTYNSSNANAVADCEEDGAYLPSLGDAYEQAFVGMVMSYFGVDSAWLGMRRGAMGQFQWLDGWPVQYTNWAKGYPIGSNDVLNDCVVMTHEGWRNVNCYSYAHPTVCKITTAPQPPPPDPPSGDCRKGWIAVDDRCFFFDTQNTEVSYVEALVLCQQRGANVFPASSLSREVNTFLQINASAVLDVNKIWLGLFCQDGEFQWNDGSLYYYTNWAGEYPTLPIESNACVQLSTEGSGQWRNSDCFIKAGYVCVAPYDVLSTKASTTGGTTTGQPPPVPTKPKTLSTEAIIGISFGCGGVALITLLAFVSFMYEKHSAKHKRNRIEPIESESNSESGLVPSSPGLDSESRPFNLPPVADESTA
ncbi:macrophage mannose receptor 1-like [Acanthaster planci]|uniref:Macrophage mannose receptor 1-like n=1 Tax=Acanthaster planci TaxID=133434 RepID=A0A8B7ZWM7_ACAPL|nr:macrophage mannose receptor 1-like [Acanthaster planci]